MSEYTGQDAGVRSSSLPKEVKSVAAEDEIVLSTILLSWNRAELLARTLESYLATVTVPYELIILDNGSTDESPHLIAAACEGRPSHQAVLLPDNLGGEAINIGIERCRGRYVHVSENDIEYLPGWDETLLAKLRTFPNLGQISPYSPFPRAAEGEVSVNRPASAWSKDGMTVYVARRGVTTTCVVPREVYERGARWTSKGSGKFRFPRDARFSRTVKRLGYIVAWNDTYVVKAVGRYVGEFKNRLPYYLENYAAKTKGLERLNRRLREHGYGLVQHETGRWSVQELAQDARAVLNPEGPAGRDTAALDTLKHEYQAEYARDLQRLASEQRKKLKSIRQELRRTRYELRKIRSEAPAAGTTERLAHQRMVRTLRQEIFRLKNEVRAAEEGRTEGETTP